MKIKRIAVLALSFCMIFGVMAVNADYSHRVTVSAGNGQFDADPGTGTSATIDISARTVTVKDAAGDEVSKSEVTKFPDGKDADGSKYFILGMKLAGHDNEEDTGYVFTDTVNIYSGSALPSYKEKDTDLVIAYGLKSNMVGYTVRYVDSYGNQLLPEGHYYGTIGTEMVVSYLYVEGFIPNAYAASRTLSANEAANVFTFTYNEYTGTGQVIVIDDGTIVINGGGGAGGAGGTGDGTAIGDGEVPQAGPADVIDLDDNDTPTTDNPDGTSDIDDGQTPKTNWAVIGGGAALVVAIAAAAIAIARRRREDEEDEE